MSELTASEIDLIGHALEHSGMTDDEIDEYFLEHTGVKGMKWGVRRSKSRESKSQTQTTDKHRPKIDSKPILIAAGASFVAHFLVYYGAKKLLE